MPDVVVSVVIAAFAALGIWLEKKTSRGPRTRWIEFLFLPDGRITRRAFWLRFVAPAAAIYLIVFIVWSSEILLTPATQIPPGCAASTGWVPTPGCTQPVSVEWLLMVGTLLQFSGAFVWPTIAVAMKRCHDRGWSGWYLLILFIPTIGFFWLLIELGFFPGTRADNRFGPNPRLPVETASQ